MKRFGSNLFNLMELSSLFGRREGSRGFQGVLGAAGTISGRGKVPEKIQFGLNRHLRQPFAAISSRKMLNRVLRSLWDASRPFLVKKTSKNYHFGPWGPWGPPWAPAALRDLREAHCTLVRYNA